MTSPLELVVLDFDGTVCDSADVKTEAFRLLYLDEQGAEFADAVQRYHLDNVGVSRYDKIRHVEERMLGREATPQRVEEVAARFAALVVEQVIASPLLPGVAEFVGGLHGRVPVAIASATPTDELRTIVAAKGLDGWFAAVEGSPETKGEIVRGYLRRFGADPARTVMVGDQLSDLRAAEEAGTRFVGVRPPDGPRVFAPSVEVVADFRELGRALQLQ